MDAKRLRRILGDTKYTVHFRDGKVCVGSSMCSELITVDAKTMKMRFALDAFNEGRKAIKSAELEFIWDTLIALVAGGELRRIIDSNDATDGMIPVYSFEHGVGVVERFADEIGWPHSAHDGTLMYDNTFFKTRAEAVAYGIDACKSSIKYGREAIAEMRAKLDGAIERCKAHEETLARLESNG